MSSDNQFTALGPAVIGFQTNGANIQTGADVTGKNFGVISKGGLAGVSAESPLVGVKGKGATGVFGEGLTGVTGQGTGVGVTGEGFVSGIKGVGTGPLLAVGVEGEGRDGPGVRGVSEVGPGGEFISKNAAQLHLQPLEQIMPSAGEETLSIDGRPGDMLMAFDARANLALWVCVSERTDNSDKPFWRKVAFV